MSFNDIEALVNETFRITNEDLSSQGEIDSLFKFDDPSVIVAPQNKPGLFFNVDKKSRVFIIRCLETDNLARDYGQILNNPENYPSLKIDLEKDIHSQLLHFECKNLQIAKSIKENISHKRFPLEEENLFNVSDHSDHWWVDVGDSEMTISFKLRSNNQKSFKIGALGDAKELGIKLKKLYGYFKLLFPISEYSLSDSQFKISTSEPNNPIFEDLKNIFISGDTHRGFWNYLSDLELRSKNELYVNDLKEANSLLLDLASNRRFWKLVDAKI